MKEDWDSLRIFVALARAGTAARAATRLGVSESTIRRRVAELEARFESRLFDRVDGDHQLTVAGKRLFGSAEDVERTIIHASEVLHGGDSSLSGHVRIGAPDGIGSIRIAPALAHLQESLPELTIELITLSRAADLNRREVDIAIMPSRPETGADHRIRALPSLLLQLYASRQYLEQFPPIASPACLKIHRLVGYPDYSGFGGPMTRAFADIGLEQALSFSSFSIIAQAYAVAAGAGIALLPDYVVQPHLDLVPVLHDLVRVHFPLWIMIHADVAELARVRAVINALDTLLKPAENPAG